MRYALLMVLLLTGCGIIPKRQATVTITKTVPVFPPSTLYGLNGGCKHGQDRSGGTVNDMAQALITERTAVDNCLGDRASLRQWVKDNSQ